MITFCKKGLRVCVSLELATSQPFELHVEKEFYFPKYMFEFRSNPDMKELLANFEDFMKMEDEISKFTLTNALLKRTTRSAIVRYVTTDVVTDSVIENFSSLLSSRYSIFKKLYRDETSIGKVRDMSYSSNRSVYSGSGRFFYLAAKIECKPFESNRKLPRRRVQLTSSKPSIS